MSAPKKPRVSSAKAEKPELKPLDSYLAELLSPALNRNRLPDPVEAPARPGRPKAAAKKPKAGGGFGEAPQA
ncbi:hypothetical protein ACFQ12_22380, partial [Methylobacterium trifolii]